MAFPTLPTHETMGPELAVVMARTPGAASWTVMGQMNSISASSEAEERTSKRVGSADVLTKYGAATHRVEMSIFAQPNMQEIARMLGVPRSGTWAGTELIKLDTSKVVDIVINRYANTDGLPVSAQYLNAFRGGSMKIGPSAEAQDETADISGACITHYIMMAAGS